MKAVAYTVRECLILARTGGDMASFLWVWI